MSDANRRYPKLTPELASQLADIPLTDGHYRAGSAVLRDGSKIDCVYFAEAGPWFRSWGVWPDENADKRALDVREVVGVERSSHALPSIFAEQIYEAGESGMGYTLFAVQFADGSSMSCYAGNAIDFVDYPKGQNADTVVAVVPHAGRGDPNARSTPQYSWCLYDP